MAFYINNSANTSHPLMDAIVKYSKIILDDMVLKNEEVATSYETPSSLEWSDYFLAVKNGSMRLGFFPPTLLYAYLREYGYSGYAASNIVEDPTKVTKEESEQILAFCNKRFLEDYEEENLYYRRLNGLPPIDTDEFDIYIDYETYGQYLDIDNARTDFDFSKPIHEYSVTEITTLETIGIMDILYDKYINNNEDKDSREGYKYLRFLGGRKIDIYTARIANNWDILYMPPVDIYVSTRFKELYAANRNVYERKIDQLAYSVRSDHFQEMVMFMIVCQTFNDMIVDTPEWYIRRDIIDLRSVQYFLESQGVKFFEDIPMRYQIRIVKNLNRLIRYKSTDKNIFDILEIFASEDTQVYQYYLLKKYRTTDLKSHTITGFPPPPEEWEMASEYDYGEVLDDEDSDDDSGEESSEVDEYEFDFQDFDDPNYIVNDEVLYMYDYGSEETPNIAAWTTLPKDAFGNYVLDGWWEDNELYHYGDEDHTDILNSTGDGYGNDMIGNDPLGDPYEVFDYGMESATAEYDDLSEFELYTYDFGWEEEHIVEDYKTTEARMQYEQSTRVIKDQAGNIYDLEFIKVPIDDQYDNYIKDFNYRVDYDEITLDDKYWDGEDNHAYVKNQHLATSYYDNGTYRDHDFTIEGTKFMGLEYNVSLSQFSYEQNYYLGMLLNTKIDVSAINIGIPSIQQNTFFNIRNIILFLYCCNGLYTGEDIDVNNPSEAVIKRDNNPIPDFEPFIDIDGGYVWTGDGKDEDGGPVEWELPNLDFGSFNPEDEINLREYIDCGEEEEYPTFESEFDGTVYDYGDEEYYIIPGHMDREYDFGEEESIRGIMDTTGAQIFEFDHDSLYPADNNIKDLSGLYEFGYEDGYELLENYDIQIQEYYKELEEQNNIYHTIDDIVDCESEDDQKDEWYDYNHYQNMEFGYEDLEEYLANTAPDYASYIFPTDDINNDPVARENATIEGIDEEDIRARVSDEISEMGDEDYIQFIDMREGQAFIDGSYDFAFYDELHPIGDKPKPVEIPYYWLENGEDECGDESPEIEYIGPDDAIFDDEDDEEDDTNATFVGPCEDDAHPEDILAMADYGCEDDGTYIKFIGEDYDCGNEEDSEEIMDMSNALEIDFETFYWDYDRMSEEQVDLYYNGINGGDEDNSESEPVPGSILVSTVEKVNGYDREDEDVMHIVYDFGYHYDLDQEEYLYDYDYGEITKTSIDTEELLLAEMNEPEPHFHNMDFGYEDKDNLFYSEYTVVYEMGDYVSIEDSDPNTISDGKDYDMGMVPDYGNDYIEEISYDFLESTETSDDYIMWKVYDFGYMPDSNETYIYRGFNSNDNVVYGSRSNNAEYILGANEDDYVYVLSEYDLDDIWDCGEITEESDDTITPDKIEYDEGTFNFYTDEKYYHLLRVTKDNYTSIIGQYYINQRNGDLYKITNENASSFIGKLISYLDWWWNIDDHQFYEEDYNGSNAGEMDLVINIDNYEMIIGQQYVNPLTGDREVITREKALSYTYTDLEFFIDNDNKEKFIHSQYLHNVENKWYEITWSNVDNVVERANTYYDGKITVRVNSNNYKKLVGTTYIDPPSGDHLEFDLVIGKRFTYTNVSILDWYWNNTNRDFIKTYYLNADGGRMPYNLVTQSYYYDYIRSDHTLLYKDCMGRIYGFNMAVELEQLEDDINFNHSKFGFKRAYTLKDLGCDTYIVQRKFNSLAELYQVYENNTKCYNNIKALYENAESRDEKRVIEYVFYTLFTRPYDMEFYIINNGDIAKTYDQVLEKHDYTLYKKYRELQDEVETTTRIYNVRNIMNDLVDTLSYYMNRDTIKYALSFIYTCSFDAMLNYIQEMIDFFKSWKVQFVGRKINYSVDDKMNNTAIYGDQIGEAKYKYYGAANGYMSDTVKVNVMYFPRDGADRNNRNTNFDAEVIDLAAHYVDNDIFFEKDYDGCRLGKEESMYAGEDQIELDGGRFYEIINEDGSTDIHSQIDEYCYYQINGGRLDKWFDLHDLDGGGVRDYRDNGWGDTRIINDNSTGYCDIDGGSFAEKYIGYDYMINGNINQELGISRKPYNYNMVDPRPKNQEFKSYDINGGIPNIHTIYTPTAITRISSFNEVSVDVRIASIPNNGLEIVYTQGIEPPVWPMRNVDFGDEDKPDQLDDYGDLDNPGDSFIIGDITAYGNEDESPNSVENTFIGLDEYYNENDEDYAISYIDNRTSVNYRVYEFGEEEIDRSVEDAIEGELIYDYGELISGTDNKEDMVDPDYKSSDIGLYFDYTKYASASKLANAANTLDTYGKEREDELKDLNYIMSIVQNEETATTYVRGVIAKKLFSMGYILSKFGEGEETYRNNLVDYLERIYSKDLFFWYNEVDPFSWTDFGGNKIRTGTEVEFGDIDCEDMDISGDDIVRFLYLFGNDDEAGNSEENIPLGNYDFGDEDILAS